MNIVIKKEVAQWLGYDKLLPWGVSRDSWETWRETQDIDLAKYSERQVEDLLALFQNSTVRGTDVLAHDIKVYQQLLLDGATEKKARTVRQFETLLKHYLLHAPGHRLYKRHSDGAVLCYYVDRVDYHPPVEMSRERVPAYVSMHLMYEEIGGGAESRVDFHAEDCLNVPTSQVLDDQGYHIESPILRADYLKNKARYIEVAQQVGGQFWARGFGYTLERDSWRSSTTQLDRYGEPARVVVDVFREDGKETSDHHVYPHEWFWPNVLKTRHYDPITDSYEAADDEDVVLARPEIELPIHPWLIVFHLAKHLRLRIHVGQLEEYVYDDALSDKLILPEDHKQLVQLLIDTKGGAFKDIIKGKGGGAVVLLTGEPGVGKTLTAEVYAESEHRPLYSVQCSQLGTSPDNLEKALLQVFERARRWDAVMLLDEADVYVHERGNSMAQNAIVGVFLRVLEYQDSVLFLTSNRPQDVDDAIASRCIARLHYDAPDAERATRIWHVLAETSDIALDDEEIDQIVSENPGMTGRDIKNILKLASLMEGGVTVKTVNYIKQFKPTGVVA